MTFHPSRPHHFRQFAQSTVDINEMINKYGPKAYYIFVNEQFKTESRSLGIFDSRRWFEINLFYPGDIEYVIPLTESDKVDVLL